MKRIFTLLLITILAVTAIFAQEVRKNYQFNNITGIDAGYAYNIKITKGNSDKIEVICPSYLEEYLDITSYNNILSLKVNLPRNFRHPKNSSQNILVNIQMKTIKYINLSGASSLSTIGEFTTENLECDLSGASFISGLNISGRYFDLECSGASNLKQTGNFEKMDLDCSGASKISLNGNINEIFSELSGAIQFNYTGNSKNIDIESSGASKAILNGKCESIKIDCSGASYVNAKAMITQNASIETSGASKVSVFSSGVLKVEASAGSSVNYYGSPKQILSKPSNIRKAD